jgi:predicted PhzF superfamily epimerase YddE/YHI9
MPRSPWVLLVLVDAIDALSLQRSYAFASRPGEGNPASVGVLRNAEAWPEAPAGGEATAFVRPAAQEDAYDVRYFAGGAEIAFCGHATLAAADAVLDSAPGARVDLETSSGKTVAATRSSDGAVELRLAAGVPAEASPNAVAAATAALGVEAVDARYFDDTTLVIELSPDDYASLDAVDAVALKDVRLVVAATTRASSGDLAFRSRCFVGGAEDLACGVAHCGLGPYWAPRLGADGFMRARQDSPTGARLDVALDGDEVLLRGRVSRDTFREKLRRGVRRLADALIAPLPKTRSIEDEAKVELIKGGVLRALFIGGTALASAWSLTLFGAKWTAPQWQAPRVKQPVLVAPKPKTPVFMKPQWRFKTDS